MTFLRSHISIFILLLFILCSNYIFGQDLKGNNVILPATNSTVGSIKIGSWNALNMYGIKNIYVGNSGNFNSPASDSNAAFGYGALRLINNASRNVAIGPYAGGRIVNADGNVWIGNEAGNDSTFKNIDNIGGIDNSDTICPLIYFDFENNQVRICGTLDVNNGITGIDSVLWYLNGDTIINKSRHLVTIDSGLFLPHPQSNTRLGYVLAWEHTNGRVFPVEISQLSDTITEVGVGYWTLDSLNGIIYLNDTNWYTRLMTLGVDEITSFTPDLETHYDINCDTVFVDTTQGFYEFNYSDQSVSITGNEFNYDIELGDRIFVYFHCVSSMPGCDTNFYLTPRVYFDVDSIDYNETFDSVTYIGDGMNYSPCQSDMCSYDQELYYKIGYIKCDDSVATTTYPVTINDNVIILGDTIKIPNLIEDTTNKIIYYNEADGRISYGELSSNDIWYLDNNTAKTNYHVKVDSSFWMSYNYRKLGVIPYTIDSAVTMGVSRNINEEGAIYTGIDNDSPYIHMWDFKDDNGSFLSLMPTYATIGNAKGISPFSYINIYSDSIELVSDSTFIHSNTVVDSSFVMKYRNYYFGYGDYYGDLGTINNYFNNDTVISFGIFGDLKTSQWIYNKYNGKISSILMEPKDGDCPYTVISSINIDTTTQISAYYNNALLYSSNISNSSSISTTPINIIIQSITLADTSLINVSDTSIIIQSDSIVINGDLNVTGQVKYDYKHLVIYTTGGAYTPNVANGVEFKLVPTFSTTENDGFTFAGDSITIVTPGDYFIMFSTVLQGANGSDWVFKCRKNGTAITTGNLALSTTGAGNYITGTWDWYLLSLAAGDDISFSVTNEGGTDDPTFRSIKVFMEMKPE